MNFTTPNSAGYEERDLAEMNDCHAPDSGKFCSGGGKGKRTTIQRDKRFAPSAQKRADAAGWRNARRSLLRLDQQARQGQTSTTSPRFAPGAQKRADMAGWGKPRRALLRLDRQTRLGRRR